MKTILVILILLLVVAPIAALLVMSTHTVLSLAAPVKIIGVSTPVAVRMANPHGVRRFSAYAEQKWRALSSFRAERARAPLVVAPA